MTAWKDRPKWNRVFLWAVMVMALCAVWAWAGAFRIPATGTGAYTITATSAGGGSGYTTKADTVTIHSPSYPDRFPKGIWGWIRLGASATTNRGVGNRDTCLIKLLTETGSKKLLIDSFRSPIPGSLYVCNYVDSMFKGNLRIALMVTDTSDDSAFSWTYPVSWQLSAEAR